MDKGLFWDRLYVSLIYENGHTMNDKKVLHLLEECDSDSDRENKNEKKEINITFIG